MGRGRTGAEAGAEAGAETGAEATAETVKKIEKLLVEERKVLNEKLAMRQKKYQNRFFTKLIESVSKDEIPINNVKMTDKNVKINETVNSMIKDIDEMLGQ